MSSRYLGKHEPQKLGLFSHPVYRNGTVFACYIFDIPQPILIILAGIIHDDCAIRNLFKFSCLFPITSL